MSRELPRILIKNSLNILGLSASATLKEIRKRAQLLLQMAKIEESQEFDTDLGSVRELRNESEIRLALERITGIKDRLKELFFWFDDYSIKNQRSIALISKRNYQEAIELLEQSDHIDWLEYKNLGLALIWHAFTSSNLVSFCRSLAIWNQLVESDDFWKFYEKYYLHLDELGTDSLLFQEFRVSIYEFLSRLTVDFYQLTKDCDVIAVFHLIFGQIGQSIDSEIIQPIVFKIKKEIENLKTIIPEADRNIGLIDLVLKTIYTHFLNLDKFTLSKYSPLIIFRNDTADQIRNLFVSNYNKTGNTALAFLLLDQCAKIAVSKALEIQIEADKKLVLENEFWKTFSLQIDKLNKLITAGKIEEAKHRYLYLDSELENQQNKASQRERISLLLNFCSQSIEKGHELCNKETIDIKLIKQMNIKKGIKNFDCALQILKNHLFLIEFAKSFSGPLDIINKLTTFLQNQKLDELVDNKDSYFRHVDSCASMQKSEPAQIAIQLLGGALFYAALYRRIHKKAQARLWGKLLYPAVAAVIFICNITSKSSKPPSYQHHSSKSVPSVNRRTPPQKVTTAQYYGNSESLTYAEKSILEYLKKNEPEQFYAMKKLGYSDKLIAQTMIEKWAKKINDKNR
jgi:hypothetical protein